MPATIACGAASLLRSKPFRRASSSKGRPTPPPLCSRRRTTPFHGGLERWFEPIGESEVLEALVWAKLVGAIGSLFEQVRHVDQWFIEAHQFRIDTANGIGRPTPEGAHRDGVDFVAVILAGRPPASVAVKPTCSMPVGLRVSGSQCKSRGPCSLWTIAASSTKLPLSNPTTIRASATHSS